MENENDFVFIFFFICFDLFFLFGINLDTKEEVRSGFFLLLLILFRWIETMCVCECFIPRFIKLSKLFFF